MEHDEIGRRVYSPEIMSKVCICPKGWTWKASPLGPAFKFVHDKCLKPSRYAAVEECENCEKFFFNPFQEPRYACWDCLED